MSVFNLLRATNSTLDKEHILRGRVTDSEKQAFYHAYNPELTYGLNYGSVPDLECTDYDSMFELLHHLSVRNLSGNAARGAVDSFAHKNGSLIKAICNKDLDCGVTATTLNKVFGKDFIPTFKVQLAMEVPLEKVSYPCLAQTKYNGVRVIALVRKGEVTFKTRNGKTFEFPALARFIEENVEPGFMLDGELCIGDSQGYDHTSVSGIVNSAIHGTPIVNPKLVYNVFDSMPLSMFLASRCDVSYTGRLNLTGQLVGDLEPMIRLDIGRIVNSAEEAQLYFDDMLADGYEGLILKSLSHKYSFKRSKDWIKVKAIKEADLLCTGWTEGEGKYEGMIGTLVCTGQPEDNPNCPVVTVEVGSGLTDEERAERPELYVGKLIRVKYNTIIQNRTTMAYSLFLPRFDGVRYDK